MTKITIPITDEQWNYIQQLMKEHNCSQEEAIQFLMVIGLREMNFSEENA